MRWAPVLLLLLVACNDLRDFRGPWQGRRVGDAAVLYAGFGSAAISAALSIDEIDAHGLKARLAIDGVLPETAISSLPGAEADVLAGLTFTGAPLRVYLAFVAIPQGSGGPALAAQQALVVIALYEDRRVEVRLLGGGSPPLYGIFALRESDP